METSNSDNGKKIWLGGYTYDYVLEYSGINAATDRLIKKLAEELGLNMRQDQYVAGKRLMKIFKDQGVTACSCGETSHMECPEHLPALIDYYEKDLEKKKKDKGRRR